MFFFLHPMFKEQKIQIMKIRQQRFTCKSFRLDNAVIQINSNYEHISIIYEMRYIARRECFGRIFIIALISDLYYLLESSR